ncbi:hypothetical protein [Paralimibaculum aggregatum]|uniref:hypothetical protein n=1 Tax=Paralimibaculum aggregatum TaxID=3036245 RepID=UPI0025577F42|nr:hypothetical protein [Limibaculum sp. NKW23]
MGEPLPEAPPAPPPLPEEEPPVEDPGPVAEPDPDHAPDGLTLEGGRISEAAAGGTVAARLLGSDPGAGDTLSYALVGPAGSPAVHPLFEIDGDLLRLRDGAALDHETAPEIALTIRVTDAAGGYLDVPAVIAVTDANEAPTAIRLDRPAAVAENSPGAVVAGLAVADPDAGDRHRLAVSDGRFEVVADAAGALQLRLKAGVLLDHEAEPQIALTMTATDAGGASHRETVRVAVTDIDEAPALAARSAPVPEDAAAGTVVARFEASDPEGGAVGAALVDAAGARLEHPLFEIAGGEIRLREGAALDHEAAPGHALTLQASDAAGNAVTQALTITVTDVNEAPDGLALEGGRISEAAAGGRVAARLLGSDPDAGDALSYALVGPAGSPAMHPLFEIDGDLLRLRGGAALDHETAPEIALTIRVSDAEGAGTDRTVLIAVTDVDEAPSLRAEAVAVPEDAAAGTVVARFEAADPEGGAVTYRLVDGAGAPLDHPLFEIAGGSHIRLREGAALDHETAPGHALTLQASDAAGNAATQALTITVTDVNQAPTAILYADAGHGAAAPGKYLGDFLAVDDDPGDSHGFRLLEGGVVGGEPDYWGPHDTAVRPYLGSDAGRQGSGLRLVSEGRIHDAAGNAGESVWRLRNGSDSAREAVVSLNGQEVAVEVPAHGDLALAFPSGGTATLYHGGVQVDVAASGSQSFEPQTIAGSTEGGQEVFEIRGDALHVVKGVHPHDIPNGPRDFVIEATDGAGNTLVETVTVDVWRPGGQNHPGAMAAPETAPETAAARAEAMRAEATRAEAEAAPAPAENWAEAVEAAATAPDASGDWTADIEAAGAAEGGDIAAAMAEPVEMAGLAEPSALDGLEGLDGQA